MSVLRELHDELDAAVFDAYGWPHDLTDEQILERLVALNAERADEERRGIVRWLRPDFQNPTGSKAAAQVAIPGADAADEDEASGDAAAAAQPWPKKLPQQIAAVRDLVLRGTWTVEQVASAFKGAKRRDVEAVLESLSALGFLVAFDVGEVRQWAAPARSAAG